MSLSGFGISVMVSSMTLGDLFFVSIIMNSWIFNIFYMFQPIAVVILTDEQVVSSLAGGRIFKWVPDPSSL